MGITIIDIKVVGTCSKHRKVDDKVLKDKNGVPYKDNMIACVECGFNEM